MNLEQRKWTAADGWVPSTPGPLRELARLVLAFGATQIVREQKHFQAIKEQYPNAHILGCSTAGEICGTSVLDDSLVTTAVHFEHTRLKAAQVRLSDMEESFQAGERLASALDQRGWCMSSSFLTG